MHAPLLAISLRTSTMERCAAVRIDWLSCNYLSFSAKAKLSQTTPLDPTLLESTYGHLSDKSCAADGDCGPDSFCAGVVSAVDNNEQGTGKACFKSEFMCFDFLHFRLPYIIIAFFQSFNVLTRIRLKLFGLPSLQVANSLAALPRTVQIRMPFVSGALNIPTPQNRLACAVIRRLTSRSVQRPLPEVHTLPNLDRSMPSWLTVPVMLPPGS